MLTNSIIYDYYLTINMSYFVFFYFFVCESTISMGSLKYVQCSNISYETNNLMIISESIINHKIQKPWDGTLNYYYSHDLFMFLFFFFYKETALRKREPSFVMVDKYSRDKIDKRSQVFRDGKDCWRLLWAILKNCWSNFPWRAWCDVATKLINSHGT